MIDVKVRQRDVRDRLPLEAQLGEPPRDAAPAVDEQPKAGRLRGSSPRNSAPATAKSFRCRGS